MYETYGRIASVSEYVTGMYANALENVLSNITPCEETIFRVLGN